MKNKSKLCYITPDSWLTNVNTSKFRKWLINDYSITSILDWYKPFDEAPDMRCNSIVVNNEKSDTSIRIRQLYPPNPRMVCREFTLDSKLLKQWVEKEWEVYITPQERPIVDKMRSLSVPMSELFNVKYGYRTGDNPGRLSSENGLFKVVEGKNIIRYHVNPKTKYLKDKSNLSDSFIAKEFPAPKVLIQYVRSNTLDVDARWLECAYIDEPCVPLNSLNYITKKTDDYDIKYSLAVLNSFLMNRYYRLRYTDVNVKTKYVAGLPIPRLNAQQQAALIEKVNILINTIDTCINKREEFLVTVKYKFQTTNIDNKFKKFYLMDFEKFMKELEKISPVNQPEKIVEWREFFLKYQRETIGLIQTIFNTSKELDDLIYDIYGVSPADRDIVKKYCNASYYIY